MAAFHALMIPPLSTLTRAVTHVDDPMLRTRLWDIEFSNPVGLAAGFDKQARWFNSLRNLGFSHIEVGTITGQAQTGNPQPRLFRLPADQGLINRMGFNNPGADAVARQLQGKTFHVPVGINIGKTKDVELADATDDYLHGFRTLFPYARYFTINVSSPNTPGLRSLQARGPLVELLMAIQSSNRELAAMQNSSPRPILLKIAPDLNDDQLSDIASIVSETQIDGLIATNTTTSRDGLVTPQSTVVSIGEGGLSGKPLTLRSRKVVQFLHRETGGRVPIIGAGGIMNGEDAWQMICHGASLVQVYTGFVYGGPMFVRNINRHLVRRLHESGMTHVSDAVGASVAV